jgi:hypothetical protein
MLTNEKNTNRVDFGFSGPLGISITEFVGSDRDGASGA